MEQQVAQLEKELAAARKAGFSQHRQCLLSDTQRTGVARLSYADQPAMPRLPVDSTNADGSIETSDEEGIVDTLATTAFSHEPELGIGHFGPSSNHGYFRALSNVFAHLPEDGSAANPKSLHRWSQYRQVAYEGSAPGVTESQISDPSINPDAAMAMQLFTQFFAAMSLTTPYLSRSIVVRNFNQAYEGHFRQLTKVRRALFNIIWAHGAVCARRTDFEIFYRRAVRFLNSITIREAGDELGKI